MIRYLLFSFLSFIIISLQAQNIPVRPSKIGTGTYWGLSKPLRDIPPMTAEEFHQMELKAKKRILNKDLGTRLYPFASTALPKGDDPVWQRQMGTKNASNGPEMNFDGQNSPYFPPDCNGVAGPDHFMQTINTVYAIYDKTGALVAGPTNMNQLFGSVPGATRNDGDPIILYDEQADRWFATEFSIPYSGPNYLLVAVSSTNDPTGTWHQYSFQVDAMPDYPKYGIWRDGYYVGDNNSSGKDIYVFEREQMLNGGTAQMVGFNNPWRPTSVDGFMCVPPIDNDGEFAPVGTPGMFIAFNDDALGGGTDQLWLYELAVDWSNPTASTFVRTQQLDVQPFDADFGNNWNNIEQKGVSQRVDAIPQVNMNVPQYRNFGSYQTIVCCHTVNVDGVRHAGIRWYELRKTTGNWVVRQQSTFAPDSHSRWMGSIMLNGSGELGLGYSISSTTEYPGIRYCGQTAAAFAAGNSTLDIEEDTIIVGANSQTGANRWGDYSQVSVDPSDDKTFWFTTQYIGSGNARKTRIASFIFNSAPVVQTLAADTVTYYSANLNGTVNPGGVPTEYHFEYGLSPSELNNLTPVISAGSGIEPVPVRAHIDGLSAGTNYFFRVVGSSIGGTANGNTLRLTTPLAPFLNVTPPDRPVAANAGNTEFYISSNVNWTVSSDADWCTVDLSGGTGNDTLGVVFTENLSVDARVAHITVTGSGIPEQVVTVTQTGATPFLVVTPPNRDVTAPSGETQFTVTSNTLWSVLSDADWCTVTPSGSGIGTIIANYSENLSIDSRKCTITVSASGTLAQLVTVTQTGAQPLLNVTPLNQNVSAQAGNTNFTVNANFPWIAESNASWCTLTVSGGQEGTITADFTQNLTYEARIATIKVSSTSSPSLFPTQEVTVTQAKSAIGIDDPSLTGIMIYPNPAKDYVKISAGRGYQGEVSVEIQDMHGKKIYSEKNKVANEFDLNLKSIQNGTYFITIQTASETLTRKLVILR